MTNKVLEALERVRERIHEEVLYLKRPATEYKCGLYDAKGINKVLREEINKDVREGERTLKPKKVIERKNIRRGSRKRK